MDGVRLIARIFGITGWITLVVGGLGILGLAGGIGAAIGPRGGVAALVTVLTPMVPLLFLALGHSRCGRC